MKKRFFYFVCKTENGSIYVNSCLDECSELQTRINYLTSIGVTVLDVKSFVIDLSEYEY